MESKTILITGATGNVGLETFQGLIQINAPHKIICGVRQPDKAGNLFSVHKNTELRKFDFEDASTFGAALKDIDIVFLLRPPQLADVKRYFKPFFEAVKDAKISKIVFLSVLGVESQKSIPHHKIEKLIVKENFDYIFLRPGYFMQNLITTLFYEIDSENRIYVPSGKLKLNWVDAKDVGLTTAHVLNDFEQFKNQAFDITGSEVEGFNKVAAILSEVTGKEITYKSPTVIQFYRAKRKQRKKNAMIFVMLMLHFLPRFQIKKSKITDTVKHICGKNPNTIREFLEREKDKFR